MIYAKLKYFDGHTEAYCFQNWDKYNTATFSPTVETLALIELKASGKTYAERQASAIRLALDFQEAENDADIGLSYMECVNISNAFYEIGKRCGLLNEFRGNGLC